jgi:hypothetical protein
VNKLNIASISFSSSVHFGLVLVERSKQVEVVE